MRSSKKKHSRQNRYGILRKEKVVAELEFWDLDDEDIDAAADANYISPDDDAALDAPAPVKSAPLKRRSSKKSKIVTSKNPAPAPDASPEAFPEVSSGDVPDMTPAEEKSRPVPDVPDETTPEKVNDAEGSLFPIRTSEGLVHQERRKKPRPEIDPAWDEKHPDYAITFTSGVTNKIVKRFYLPHVRAQLLAIFSFILAVLVLCFLVFSAVYILRNERLKITQASEVSMYRTENETLIQENVELRSLVNQLSVSVNRNQEDRRAQELAYQASLMPSGYPLSQFTSMEPAFLDAEGNLVRPEQNTQGEEDTEDADTENTPEDTPDDAQDDTQDDAEDAAGTNDALHQIGLFVPAEDSYVRASGTGIVTRINADPNFGMMLLIDHGNGYSSIYRTNGTVLVSVGDSVMRGDRLFAYGTQASGTDGETEEETEETPAPNPAEDEDTQDTAQEERLFGYQIQLNDDYLDPAEMIELGG